MCSFLMKEEGKDFNLLSPFCAFNFFIFLFFVGWGGGWGVGLEVLPKNQNNKFLII